MNSVGGPIKRQTILGDKSKCSGLRVSRTLLVFFLSVFFLYFINGCNESDNSTPTSRVIPDKINPCENLKYWPYKMASESSNHPFWVHYRSQDDLESARKIVKYLDIVWNFEVNELGFPPPLPDHGECGPDSAFDVFIWEGIDTCYVQVIHEKPEDQYKIATEWGGRTSYMVIDPWGKYGGDILLQTMAHEFNHASHAAEDWYESGDAFEMTASYIEQYYGKAEANHVRDFQANPDWSILWYDDYRTYYMYGSALYLYFLRDRYFIDAEDVKFPARLWHSMRNDTSRPLVNKPNFVDGLNDILAPKGYSFLDSVIEFARWRYYTGKNNDKKHFKAWKDLQVPLSREELLPFLAEADIKLNRSILLADTIHNVEPPPMLLGNAYVEILSDQPGRDSFEVSLLTPENPDLRWVVQAVPGMIEGSDGEIIDLRKGSARVSFTSDGKRTLIISLLPNDEFNPDDKSKFGERFPFSIHLSP